MGMGFIDWETITSGSSGAARPGAKLERPNPDSE